MAHGATPFGGLLPGFDGDCRPEGNAAQLLLGTPLVGRFWGKTGTLSGVRSISGILEPPDGPRYVSMIANGSYAPNSVMGQILLASQRISRCPAWTAAVTLPAEPD